MHGFQNNITQLFSLRSRNAVGNICSGRLKVKVTLEGQMIKWSKLSFLNLSLSGPELVNLFIDFKIIWLSYFP